MKPGCGSPLAQKYLYPSYSDSIETWAIQFAKVFSWLHANIHFTIRHNAPTSHFIVSTSSPLLVSRRFVTSLDLCAFFVDHQSREMNSSLFLLLYTNMSNISNFFFPPFILSGEEERKGWGKEEKSSYQHNGLLGHGVRRVPDSRQAVEVKKSRHCVLKFWCCINHWAFTTKRTLSLGLYLFIAKG